MRLRRLDLARYGRFTGFSIDFGERSPEGSDFHIIYGDNEAGKSTAFDGYLDVLFGIEERSKYDFLHDYSAMRVGAVLGIDGGEIELARIKRRDGNLIGAANQPLDPAILTSALHGLSRNAYQTMFSLNDETLEHGGDENISQQGRSRSPALCRDCWSCRTQRRSRCAQRIRRRVSISQNHGATNSRR